jgi:hypothetical protein
LSDWPNKRAAYGDIVELVGLGRAVTGIIIGIAGAIHRGPAGLVQNTQQSRQGIISVRCVDRVGSIQTGPEAQRIVAEGELPG